MHTSAIFSVLVPLVQDLREQSRGKTDAFLYDKLTVFFILVTAAFPKHEQQHFQYQEER